MNIKILMGMSSYFLSTLPPLLIKCKKAKIREYTKKFVSSFDFYVIIN